MTGYTPNCKKGVTTNHTHYLLLEFLSAGRSRGKQLTLPIAAEWQRISKSREELEMF